MKLNRLNSWFTLLANLGVVAGLLFLAYETRQNTLQMRSEASYAINEGISRLNAGIYNDPILAQIIVKGEQDYYSLDSVEMRQFVAYQFDRINMAIHILVLEDEGISNVHFPYVDYLVSVYHTSPGLQKFIISVEDTWSGPLELYHRLRLDNLHE